MLGRREDFDFIAPRIRSTETFEYENTRSCDYWKIEKQYIRLQLMWFFNSIPDIVGFTDEPVVKCDVQVVDYSK